MTPERIEELEALAQAARLGPVDAVIADREAGLTWVLKWGYADGSDDMTETWAKYLAEAANSLPAALEEIKRLRALVESANIIQPCVDSCPWCVGLVGDQPVHEHECPAFTLDGKVK